MTKFPKPVYPHEFPYSDAEMWDQIYKERAAKTNTKEEITMKNSNLELAAQLMVNESAEKECFAQLLKMEIMERYGLREDQVRLQLQVHTTDLELGRQVLADFNTKYPVKEDSVLLESDDCAYVIGEVINAVYVHRKDGFYGTYVNAGADNDER